MVNKHTQMLTCPLISSLYMYSDVVCSTKYLLLCKRTVHEINMTVQLCTHTWNSAEFLVSQPSFIICTYTIQCTRKYVVYCNEIPNFVEK